MNRKGFTLIELIMVVALIAIVSTLAVMRIGDMRRLAARKVSIANQVAIGRSVDAFLVGGGQLNRLDALVDMDTPEGSPDAVNGAFDYDHTNVVARTVGYLYGGPDQATSEAALLAAVEQNEGLTPGLKSVLVPYALNVKEMNALHQMGLKFLMRHTTWADASPREKYEERGDDGVYLTEDSTVGMTAASSACVAQFVTNRMVVAAISPITNAGREIYRECGQQLLMTEKDEYNYTRQGVWAEVKSTGGVLLAFGLGENASIVGAANGGLESIPYAEYPYSKYYRQYVLLFRVAQDRVGQQVAEFAGVIDPCGLTVSQARKRVK